MAAAASGKPFSVTTHLMCLTSCGGLPLFTRKKGDGEVLPFSVVASLNGVYMFGKSLSAIMKSTSTEDCTVVWEEFEESVTLIVSAFGVPESELVEFLVMVFNAMVLHVGIKELREPRNIERLKRDLRVCYPLLDRLLSCIHPIGAGDRMGMRNCSQLTGMVECTLCHENNVLQAYLEAHVESLASMYGCVLLHGRLAVATSGWWSLTSQERTLLTLLVSSDPVTSMRDLPVFLPTKSPDVPFRLVTVQLVPGVEVLTLCGPTPALSEVESLTTLTWRHAGDVLRSLAIPRTLPPSLGFDRNVLGILLVNPTLGKYVMCTDPHGEIGKDGQAPNSAHRASILHTFHRKMTANFTSSCTATTTKSHIASPSTSKQTDLPMPPVQHRALETYWCSEFHKCHALLAPPSQLFVLYAAAVPVPTTRVISKQILKMVTSEKMFYW